MPFCTLRIAEIEQKKQGQIFDSCELNSNLGYEEKE